MKTNRLTIEHPEGMPLGPLHKALAEAANVHGLQIKFAKTQVPKGNHFEMVPKYQPITGKGAA